MAQFTKVFSSRFGTGDTAIPVGNSAFSDMTLGGALTNWRPWYEFPGCFAREGGGGQAMSLRITANDAASQDHEILACLPGPAVNQIGGVMVRSTASWTSQPNGHIRASLWGDGRLYVERVTTGGGSGNVGNINLPALGRTTRPVLCRLRVSGIATATRIQCKAWGFDQDEPSAWDIDTTPALTFNANGFPILYRNGTGFLAFLGMAFSVGTDGDSAPDLTGTISGTVAVNGSGAVRTVRAVSREDPGYYWDAVSDGSGNFSMKVLRGFTYTVYALDPLAGNFNAIVYDKIVPV